MESLLQPNKRQKMDIVAPYAPANDDIKASKVRQLSSSFNPALLLDVTQLDLDQSAGARTAAWRTACNRVTDRAQPSFAAPENAGCNFTTEGFKS